MLLLQGDEDQIVPLNQATAMYEAVKAKKIPCALVVFEGEQHGFRKAENIQRALNSEVGEKRSDREEKGNWGILRWKSVGAEYIYICTLGYPFVVPVLLRWGVGEGGT